jgi:hypothetical protein
MVWGFAILGILAFAALWYWLNTGEWRAIRARGQRAAEAGEHSPQQNPDWTPGHGGGASGG